MSDIHIGKEVNGADGEAWFRHSLDDLRENVDEIHYGLTLGDIAHHGRSASLQRYLRLRNSSPIPRWFEIAGNHEHRGDGIEGFRDLVGNTDPYCFVDGNIAWFFLSDERERTPGHMSDKSYEWLRSTMKRHRDKIIILCTHQLPPNSVRRSDEGIFCIHPKEKVRKLFRDRPIVLSLFGHEHHAPYSLENAACRGGTTYLNIAALCHASGTRTSASWILELQENRRVIVAKRRDHIGRQYQKRFQRQIPLPMPIRFS